MAIASSCRMEECGRVSCIMSAEFDATKQLEELIARYPEGLASDGVEVEISGIVLDYLGRSQQTIEDLLRRYPSLYKSMFVAGRRSDSTLTLVKTVLNDDEARNHTRKACIKHGLGELTELIDLIDDERRSRSSPRSSSHADQLAGHRVDGVVWQLSDIHFGKLNNLGLSATDLAQALGDIVRATPEFEPRFVIVSGDVSSTADSDELKQFLDFCESLSRSLWDQHRSHRFLVVPGNHESTWLKNGTADKLDNFKRIIVESGKVVTPFWLGPKMPGDSDGEVSILQFGADESQDTPPFALIRDKRLDFRVLLLVSPYYSGFVPEPVRGVLDKVRLGESLDYLHDLLREDTGEFSRSYVSHIKGKVLQHESTTIAVTHHNLTQLGPEICLSHSAKALLLTLAEKDIQLVLHGHTHLVESRATVRKPNPGEAYPVPCPTLCGLPSPANTHGFMMHLIGPVDQPRYVTSVVWSIDESRGFSLDASHLSVRYRFLISKGSLKLRYPTRRRTRASAS